MSEPRPRGLSVRVQLTLSYAGFLVVAGIAMFAVGFLILRFIPSGNLSAQSGARTPSRDDLLEVFLRYAWGSLALLALIGLVGGWILAGAVLRPLDRITDAARRARDGDLALRIGLPGRRDELTDLADTFDALLARVQHTLDEERRFAANASHELRTPQATIRTMLEVATADPEHRDVDELLRRVAVMNDRSIAVTEALLALSRVERQALERDGIDLAALAGGVVADLRDTAAAAGIRLDTELAPAALIGNAVLLRQLVANLVHNAIVHNLEGPGAVRVTTSADAGGAVLEVSNTGAPLDPAVVGTLTEPFVRGVGRVRSGRHEGAGLGLALVASIVRVHDGRLELGARPEGGLRVRVRL